MATSSNPTAAVIDASAMVAECCQEAGRAELVKQLLDDYDAAGRAIYAPGAVVSESLYVFCKKLAAGVLDPGAYDAAVSALVEVMKGVEPPPLGDRSLIAATARLAAGLTCTKTTDSMYLALAEQLVACGEVVEVVTFDDGLAKRADRVPGVGGRLLVP